MSTAFTCPVCGWASYNPTDKREGYCGHCHAFTGKEEHEERVEEAGA